MNSVCPAPLTSTSTRPKTSITSPTIARTSASFATSAWIAKARPPTATMSRTVCSASAPDCEYTTATAYPSPASCNAVALPTPVPPPVMIAVFEGVVLMPRKGARTQATAKPMITLSRIRIV